MDEYVSSSKFYFHRFMVDAMLARDSGKISVVDDLLSEKEKINLDISKSVKKKKGCCK